jgi:hypothetical protein
MADNNGWINAAMRTARVGQTVLGLRVLFDMYYAVIEQAMLREEYQVAAEYQEMVGVLWGEVGR